LLSHVDLVVVREDAGKAVSEIGAVAREVLDLVEPPMTEREQRRLAGVPERDASVEWGSELTLSRALPFVRPDLSASAKAIRTWADHGEVRSMVMPDGTRRVSLTDVIGMAEGKDARVAESRRVEGSGSA
jgi:hypothetical protein